MRKTTLPLLPVWLSLCLAGQAQAQYSGALGSTWNNPTSALISQMILNDLNRQTLQSQLQKSAASQGSQATPARRYLYPLSKTDFRFQGKPTQQRSCAAIADDQATQQQLANLCLTIFQQIEANQDFRKHNLSSGLSLLIGASWQVSSGQEFGDDQFEVLQRTLNDQLTGGQAMQKLKAQDVQNLYESGVMIGGLLLALNEQADEPSRRLAKALADEVLKSFGLKT